MGVGHLYIKFSHIGGAEAWISLDGLGYCNEKESPQSNDLCLLVNCKTATASQKNQPSPGNSSASALPLYHDGRHSAQMGRA